MNIASGAAETDVLMTTGAHKQKHVCRRTRRRCRWRYKDVSVHSSSIVRTCCGLVSQRRIYDSILLLSVVRPRAPRRPQRLFRTFVESSMELRRRRSSFLRRCGGLWLQGWGAICAIWVRFAVWCLLFAVRCFLLSAVLCCATFRACTACAACLQKRLS